MKSLMYIRINFHVDRNWDMLVKSQDFTLMLMIRKRVDQCFTANCEKIYVMKVP
jgi:hypothetical protein